MTIRNVIAVIGGGMIGAAIVLGLAQNNFQVIVIECHEPPIFNSKNRQPKLRISAVSKASISLLKLLGVWNTIKRMRVHPYRILEVWEWENAYVSFDAYEVGLSELGFMIENCVLQRALWDAMIAHPAVTLLCPARLKSLHRHSDCWILNFDNKQTLEVSMIIGADGANSQVRRLAGIGVHTWRYCQSCILITVQCESQSGNKTWQHFTPSGPRAFLPLYDNWASLVWYDSHTRIRQLLDMTMIQLQKAIVDTFPTRLKFMMPIIRNGFSFTNCHALQYVQNGLVLIGDAAHTIHPLAGQGLNLGYRDVDKLLKVIVNARDHEEDWTSADVLKRYQFHRQLDNFLMQSGINLFYAGFSNNSKFLYIVRNLSLIAIQRSRILKHWILKYALGI